STSRACRCPRASGSPRRSERGESDPDGAGPPLLLLHQRAVALVEWPEGVGGRDGGDELVVVPRRLGLVGGLHLEEIRGVNLSPIFPDRPLAEDRIVRRKLLHLGDDGFAVAVALGL